MKIELGLQPNCSESSWRLTGEKKELHKIKEMFMKACQTNNFIKWFPNGSLLLQTVDQEQAGELLPGIEDKFPTVKVYEDQEEARDCTCGGDHCPEKVWDSLWDDRLALFAKGHYKKREDRRKK